MLFYAITKTGDSDNSYIADDDRVTICDDGEYVQIFLMNPKRTFSVRFKDLQQVIKSMEIE